MLTSRQKTMCHILVSVGRGLVSNRRGLGAKDKFGHLGARIGPGETHFLLMRCYVFEARCQDEDFRAIGEHVSDG